MRTFQTETIHRVTTQSSRCGYWLEPPTPPDDPRGEGLHLLELGAELQQQQIRTCLLEGGNPLAHLFGRPDESGS